MKTLLLTLVALVLGVCATVRADDVAEARKQFDLFQQYARTNDEKLLELFAPDITVTFTVQTEKGPAHDTTLPAATFRDSVERSLTRKEENKNTYKDVKIEQEGDTVRLTCTRVDEKVGFTGPFLAIYGKDAAGQLKIKAMKFGVPPPKFSPGEGMETPVPTPADIPVPKATP